MILLDTDICIAILRGQKKVLEQFDHCADSAAISFMTAGELFYGAYHSSRIEHNLSLIERFLLSVRVIQSDYSIMKKFGELKSMIADRTLPDADILITSTALVYGIKLITGNISHFERFGDLKIENWLK